MTSAQLVKTKFLFDFLGNEWVKLWWSVSKSIVRYFWFFPVWIRSKEGQRDNRDWRFEGSL